MTDSIHKSPARDFFLYLLAIGTLYFSVWRFIDLWFDIINFKFPDPIEHEMETWIASGMRFSISSLLVIFPVYLGLTWYLRKDLIANPEKRDLKVRKWLLYFTLFLAAVTVISDLVVLVNTFLEGEITTRFVLKVLVVLITAGAIFGYYFWDLRRESTPHATPNMPLGIAAAAVMLGTMIMGFVVIGSPGRQRLARFDQQRIDNLSTIQSQIMQYWTNKGKLPASLSDLKDDISGFKPPYDPEKNTPYEYRVLGDLQFELCAEFNLESQKADVERPYAPPYYGDYYVAGNWEHGKGRVCFTRTIDPERYPQRKPIKD